MINYLILPVIIIACLLLSYVLAQDARARANRLFAIFMAVVILQSTWSLIRLTTLDGALAAAMASSLGITITLTQLLLIDLVLALFLPRRHAEPLTRLLISLPYLLALAVLLPDLVPGGSIWLAGVERGPAGTFDLVLRQAVVPLLIGLSLSQLAPILLLTGIAVRHPDRRAPAVVLCIGTLTAFVINSLPQSQQVPAIYVLASAPVYIAFAWVTLRYQIFRPSPIALQTAVESLPEGVAFLDRQRRLRYANAAARRMLALGELDPPPPLDAALAQAGLLARERPAQAGAAARYERGAPEALILDATEVRPPSDPSGANILVLRDVTKEEQREAALVAQNEEQRRLLDVIGELETPAIRVADGVLLAPIIGRLDRRRAQDFRARLLQTVGAERSRLVILDLKGLSSIDQEVAQALVDTSRALQLLGCQVTLTGISAPVAATITGLGLTLDSTGVMRSPQEAITAFLMLGRRG